MEYRTLWGSVPVAVILRLYSERVEAKRGNGVRAARWARQRTRLLEALRAVIPRRQSGSRCCSPRPFANQNGMVFTNTPTAFLEPSHGLTRYAGTRPSDEPEARVQRRGDWCTRPSLPR